MKNQMNIDRREFIKRSALAGAAFGIVGPYSISRASKSPNDKVVVAVMGGRARAGALADAFAAVESTEVKSVFDVDERPLAEKAAEIEEIQGRKPEYGTDFRKSLDDPDIDALVIGAPDHWHTPATIMALQAGKHVYVEKPASHNPREAELIVQAQKRYDRLVQMGNQQRSGAFTIQAIQEIHDGIIGDAYFGKAFYANARDSIGRGSIASVPDWLDYELWQGPAPRTPYRDNIIHYNWHWFWKWGTGEILNNATHEYDICRWALGVDLPSRVVSAGGRFHYDDDWEFYDTQDVTFEFKENKAINWEGRSANGFPMWDRGRGAVIHGTEGTVLMDRDGYIVYDLDNEEIKREMVDDEVDPLDVVGAGAMTDYHIDNFAKAIREGTPLNSPIDEGQKSVLPLHLGNISQYVGRALNINPENGRIIGDSEAMSKWSREYEPGWEPRI
ncbi:Gfo/Idh/MocA family protein [Natronogracilivirga saccharolytica]|uniref:Gfo/Idh/MocA family oxidoreductase n=1 Tax=Natronogracilivirga saccharolytica TaxID=2812953 RepID=A0A8J7S8K5_9BACT|nr:Gfo/Idh/MocA family oxidoreductase [Natronogracilivirga saccharolytica]MBP3193963.1 Gfo/Idh/MocA family oxidoreductase [Natronogracilivirga saccharolytica]